MTNYYSPTELDIQRELKETRLRSLAKTVAYRAVAFVLLSVITYAYTGNIGESTSISVVFNITAAVAYYLLERAWNETDWGKIN